jgi:hypothetical protein
MKNFNFSKRNSYRRARLALVFFCLGVFITWSFWPRPGDAILIITGIPSEQKSCGSKSCTSAIVVNGVMLSCGADPIGISSRCGSSYRKDVKVTVKYFTMPTLMSVLGPWNEANVLLEMRQLDQVLIANDIENLYLNYGIGVFGLFGLLIIMFFIIDKYFKNKLEK